MPAIRSRAAAVALLEHGQVPERLALLHPRHLGQPAVQEVEQSYGIPVVPVATLTDLIDYLAGQPELESNLAAVRRYREEYGVE